MRRSEAKPRAPAVREHLRVHEVVDHIDRLGDAEGLLGAVLEEAAHSGHPIARLDAELGDAEVRGLDPHHRDVGAVQGGDHTELARQEELPGEVGAGRERQRVVHVQDLEAVVLHDFDHLGRKREVVGRLLEDRIGRDRDLVEEDVRLEPPQPEREPAGDEVHLEPAAREREAQLGRDHAAPAEVGVAGDPDSARAPGPHGGRPGRSLIGCAFAPRLSGTAAGASCDRRRRRFRARAPLLRPPALHAAPSTAPSSTRASWIATGPRMR